MDKKYLLLPLILFIASCVPAEGLSCSDPSGNDGEYICRDNEKYQCFQGAWTYLSDCPSGSVCAIVDTPIKDVGDLCGKSCDDPYGDHRQFYCDENKKIYECEDGDWFYTDKCPDDLTCKNIEIAMDEKESLCIESGCSDPTGNEGDYWCEVGVIAKCAGSVWEYDSKCPLNAAQGYDCVKQNDVAPSKDNMCESVECDNNADCDDSNILTNDICTDNVCEHQENNMFIVGIIVMVIIIVFIIIYFLVRENRK